MTTRMTTESEQEKKLRLILIDIVGALLYLDDDLMKLRLQAIGRQLYRPDLSEEAAEE